MPVERVRAVRHARYRRARWAQSNKLTHIGPELMIIDENKEKNTEIIIDNNNGCW